MGELWPNGLHKVDALIPFTESPDDTTLEDFILREKITHFDHERIPERIVHARGAGSR